MFLKVHILCLLTRIDLYNLPNITRVVRLLIVVHQKLPITVGDIALSCAIPV